MLLTGQGPLPWALIALAAGFLFGALLLWLLRRQDHFSWVLARAPALPIRVLAGGDDAWLRGTVRCAAPLSCPWFEVACVSYSYQIERQVTHTHKAKDGKVHTRTEWQTEHREARSTDFELDDGDRIVVRVERSRNEALQGLDTDYETGRRRHSAQVLELGAEVSVLGVKQDDGSFAAEREVPCLITRQPRLQRVRKSEGSETWLFVGACALPCLGGAGATWLWLATALQQQPLYWLLLPPPLGDRERR